MSYKSQEEVSREFENWKRLLNEYHLPDERPDKEGNIAEAWLRNLRLSDLEAIEAQIESMKPILYHEDANRHLGNVVKYNTLNDILSYLQSLKK